MGKQHKRGADNNWKSLKENGLMQITSTQAHLIHYHVNSMR